MESLVSVGIDVGTTTTKVAFSRLGMENSSGPFAVPRVSVVDKQILYRSEPILTPLRSDLEIDAPGVTAIVQNEFRLAGIEPRDVSAGAVIITGESARKENAEALLRHLSGLAGDFVVATAGPDLEAVIAGKGSGAFEHSKKMHCRVINIDVGGGTTNVVLFDDGHTVATGCIEIGGRLVRVDAVGTVIGFSPAAATVASAIGIPLKIGMNDEEALRRLCQMMAELIAEHTRLVPPHDLCRSLKSPNSSSFDYTGPVDALCFSGGVADAISGRFPQSDCYRYGDIGILLGQAIAGNEVFCRLPQVSAGATIGATVIGAGIYATTVSGSTITVAAEHLPLRDLPVYRLTELEQEQLFGGDIEAFVNRLACTVSLSGTNLAVALSGEQDPSYAKIKCLARSLVDAANRCLSEDAVLVVISEADMAKVLGQCLRVLTDRPIIAIDGIDVSAEDLVDIGKPVMSGMVVPVVVKTLVFGS